MSGLYDYLSLSKKKNKQNRFSQKLLFRKYNRLFFTMKYNKKLKNNLLNAPTKQHFSLKTYF